MKKKILFFVLALVLIMTPMTAFAEQNVTITIDSKPLTFDAKTGIPFVDASSRTQVPFRTTLEAFGAKVDWDDSTQTAIAIKDGITVKVPIGQNYILKNEEKIAIDTVAILKDEKTYLPIRAVIEALGGSIEYDASVETVVIMTKPVDTKSIVTAAMEKSLAWKNYTASTKVDMTMDMNMQGTIFTSLTTAKTDTTIFTKPFKSKNETVTEVTVLGQKQTIAATSYIEATDKEIITYNNVNGQWTKDIAKNDNDSITALLNASGAQQLAQMKDFITGVKYFGNYTVDGNELQKVQVSMNMQAYMNMFKEYMGSVVQTEAQAKLVSDILLSMDGLSYTMWIDVKTGEFVKCDMELTSFMQKIFTALAASTEITAEEKVQLEAIKINNAKVVITFVDINNCKDFEIPKEAKDANVIPQQ